ncbi:carboxypeptidase-like regulatory domain-containing protein [Flavobacterium sp. TAB 87]|uniref:carboxypeptidase-like regulatory domain-containing protein n=1 Tax=Flavobacterium sp. TAB 87 TaxID=1729581 RepID=UPI0009EBB6F6|nr:carboxypeptidase-like regulatory domain-containing protein [Flavobacterium sp. TAB 87]
MIKKLLLLFTLLICTAIWSQNHYLISGKVIHHATQKPLSYVVVTLQNSTLTQLTTTDGKFEIEVPFNGNQLLLLRSQGFKDLLIPLALATTKNINLGVLSLEENLVAEAQNSWISLQESDLSDDNSTSENTSSLLQSSRDAFLQAAAFNWGQARFRVRGLDNENANMLINGLVMNKIYDGRPQWSNWGGLNDVLRNQEFTIGTAPSPYSFGGILGTQAIFTRASMYRKGTRLSFSASNTNYSARSMVSYASGMSSSGWAFVVAAGKRYAKEAYFDGTTYDAESFFMSIEKKISTQHSLNFTGFFTPNQRGKNSPNTNEVTELSTEKYNSYWGWQNGEKRNARVKTVAEPVLMLNHYFKINEKTQLNSAVAYQFGKIANSNIDYQNANSPDPTYYRKLPSYYTSIYGSDQGEYSGDYLPNYEEAEKSKNTYLANSQIDWAAMYRANQNATVDSNGQITTYHPNKSHYVLYEDRVEDQLFTANSTLYSRFSDNCTFNGGLNFRKLQSHNFQYLTDLLGGSYFEDIDAFYTGTQSQSDLQNPNLQVKVGDRYGYNYNLNAIVFDAFTQFRFDYKNIDFYLAQTFSSTQYQREGFYQNGLYPTNSLGKSNSLIFENFGFKGGFTYKISGKQWLFANASHQTKAPALRNTFQNSRLNNSVVAAINNETLNSAELNYVFHAPKLKTRLTAFYSEIKNATQISFFYAEGIFDKGFSYNNTDAFVGQALTGLNKTNKGIELSFDYQLTATLKTTVAANYGKYIYDSNPNVKLTNDAQATITDANPVFDFGNSALKNYKLPGTPQQAYSLGIEYRDPHYWWIGANINYLDDMYIDIAPISRTNAFFKNPANGYTFPEATQERAHKLLSQEKLPAVTLVNFSAGKSWRLKSKYIGLFASVNNILNSKYKTGGFEQSRNANFRELNQDVSSETPSFGSKYYYGFGRTYFANLTLSF